MDGDFFRVLIISLSSNGLLNSKLKATEWPTITGTRTAVAVIEILLSITFINTAGNESFALVNGQ